jgi:hypothetical protein
VVDGGGLENRCTRKGTRGSNPFPSANVRSRLARRLPAVALAEAGRCQLAESFGWQAIRLRSRVIAPEAGEGGP